MGAPREDPEAVSEEETEELLQEVERRRSTRGIATVVVALVGITFSAFQMWIAARGFTFAITVPFFGRFRWTQLQSIQVNAVHVTFALLLAFLLFPPTQGDGFVARQFARVVPATRSLFGDDSPVTDAARRVRGVVRWAAVDHDLDRITPLDVLLMLLSLVPTYYMLTEFEEIRQMAVFGLEATRPVQEVYPWLDPVASALSVVGVPIDEIGLAYLLGIVGILLVLEATRRTLGVLLMSLVSLFIVYARWGYLIPRNSALGALSIPQTGWDNIVYNLWYTTEAGVFGVPVSVSVRFIYIFILFGAFLEMSGAGQWFIDLAYALTGSRRGGPAKASVVSSGFMGMLSGSSVANTVTTGAFTIPLMKRSGYSPEFSGAVEASASSGGQILPPVMGAAAFLIVEFTATPFPDVITAAALPALAFFFGMWVMVHFEAVRGGIGGLDRSELPPIRPHLRRGWFYLLPLFLLLYFLIGLRLSINRAGWYTIVATVALIAVIAAYNERTRVPLVGTVLALYLAQAAAYATAGVGVLGALQGATGDTLSTTGALIVAIEDLGLFAILVSMAFLLARPNLDAPLLDLDPTVDKVAERGAAAVGRPGAADNPAFRFGTFVVKSMESGARTATTVVIAVAAAGVIPGVISVSGLGPNLTSLIISTSGESLLGLLLLSGVSAIIFGLGMPTTVMYIILVAMLGTALQEFGVALLAAHLYILYFGLMADVTPPVAVAAFAAAGVAKAEEFGTAIIAFLLSLNKIMVPLAFVYSPGILLLRERESGWVVISLADAADLGWFVPNVVIPVVGMFLGVYALGVTIIGYYESEVSSLSRGLFAVSSILLMVPEVPLVIVEGILALFGVPSHFLIFSVTATLRAIGLAMLVALAVQNKRRVPEPDRDEPTTAPGDV